MKRLLRFLFRLDHLAYRLWLLMLPLCLWSCTRPCGKVAPPPSPDQIMAQSKLECRARGDDTPQCVRVQYAANIGWYYYNKPEVKR